MKFLSIYKTAETGAMPAPEEMARMGKLVEEGMKAGFLLAVEGCMPSANGARVRLSNVAVSNDGRAFHRIQGSHRWPGHTPGQLESSRHRVGQAISSRRRGWRVRASPT